MTKVCIFVIVIVAIYYQGEFYMRKMAVFSFLFLISAIGGILFWQWNAYTEQHGRTSRTGENIHQHIVVETTSNNIRVRQTIHGMTPKKEYTFIVPKLVSQWICLDKNNQPCQQGEDEQVIIATDNKITLQYDIPFDKGKSTLLLTNWSMMIQDSSIQSTKIEIAESVRREGIWIAGAQLIGYEKLDLIDYYVFESKQQTVPLYWQNTLLTPTMKKNEFIVYQGKETNADINISLDFLKEVSDFPFTSIILTEKCSPTIEKGLIITNTLDEKQLQRQLAMQFFLQHVADEYDKWLFDLFASMMVEIDPQTDKGKNAIQQLTSNFSDAELKTFYQRVIQEETALSVNRLDDLLSDIKGLQTHFFQLNTENEDFSKLYFIDPKKVVINDKEIEIELIVENNTRLFPFDETMEAFGFEVNHFSNQILLNNKNSMIRFYKNKNIFIYNEEDYGLLENPLTEVNGEIYIEQKWLQTIFKISFNENTDRILLTK